MEGTYNVYQGEESLGKVHVQKRGLYYKFSCQCELSGQVMYDLQIGWNGGTERLGLLTPIADSRFGLEVSVPVKKIGKGDWHFSLMPRHSVMNVHFVPIHPEEPFSYLSHLEHAYLSVRDGQLGIVLENEK